ncbi:hypothetical protein [Microbispora sp. NPDC049125]|uniref:hypothetical protein n=1 Tax=Microbispora sp. NPDC049125 TaxID=3154929 RepID=UPI0034674CEB
MENSNEIPFMTAADSAVYCPNCGQTLTIHQTVGGGPPKHEDITVCETCREMSVFVTTPAGPLLRPVTEEERREVFSHPSFRAILRQAAVAPRFVYRKGAGEPFRR